MDKELENGRTCHVLKTEAGRRLSLREAAVGEQWDSVASDTESLAQERADQQQPQMQTVHHNHIKSSQSEKKNVECGQYENEAHEDSGEGDHEDLKFYDSLEIGAHSQDNEWRLQMEDLETQWNGRGKTSQLHSDEYSDLRYDPNWRTNLKAAGCFNQSPHVSVEKFHRSPKPGKRGRREPLLIKGGYRYITDTSSAPEATPSMAADEADHSYHLHLQKDQSGPVASPCIVDYAQLSRPFSSSAKNEHQSTWQKTSSDRQESNCDFAGETIVRNPKLSGDRLAEQIQDGQTHYQQEQRLSQGQKIETQLRGTSSLPRPTVSLSTNEEHQSVVQRNKISLGRNTSKCGSYVKAHRFKQATVHEVKKVHATLEKKSSTGDPDRSAHELGLLQTTQQLKVTQISKGKKAQRKCPPHPSGHQQQPPAPEVTAECGDCWNFPLAKSHTLTEPESLSQTASQLLPPPINLNIHLSNPAHLLPLRQQTSRDVIIKLASLYGQTLWHSASRLTLSPGYQPINQEGVNPEGKRTASLKWLTACEEQLQTWIPPGSHNKVLQSLPTTPSSTAPQGRGTCTVLPPIVEAMRGNMCEQSLGRRVNPGCPVQSTNSDGYLLQMEKQRQMRRRVTDKKMKRQMLYSAVIQQQDKRTSRIPLSVTKEPEGKDKEVPRLKALEYARTIVKPPARSQAKAKQRHQSEGFPEHAPHMEGLDLSQLATLDMLRKRHEEEKQAVALFKNLHTV